MKPAADGDCRRYERLFFAPLRSTKTSGAWLRPKRCRYPADLEQTGAWRQRPLTSVPDRGGRADMKSLDTNILLYAAEEDCREHDAAIGLVNDARRWLVLPKCTQWHMMKCHAVRLE
jgi:hypothetical protein